MTAVVERETQQNGASPKTDAPVSVFAKERTENVVVYDVELSFKGKLLGGVPKTTDLIEGWLRKNLGITDKMELRRFVIATLADQGVEIPENVEVDGQISDDAYEAVKAAAEAAANEQHTCGFKFNADGLYVESRQLKAMLKESINIGFAGERLGKTKKGVQSFLAEHLEVTPDEVSLGRMEPQDVERTIKHISDRNGKRSALGYYEYVEMPVLHFQVHVLDDAIPESWWPRVWVVAEMQGFGACRSQGYGTFAVTNWEKVS